MRNVVAATVLALAGVLGYVAGAVHHSQPHCHCHCEDCDCCDCSEDGCCHDGCCETKCSFWFYEPDNKGRVAPGFLGWGYVERQDAASWVEYVQPIKEYHLEGVCHDCCR